MLVLNEMQMSAISGGLVLAEGSRGHYVTHHSVDEDGNDVETEEWESDVGGDGGESSPDPDPDPDPALKTQKQLDAEKNKLKSIR